MDANDFVKIFRNAGGITVLNSFGAAGPTSGPAT